MTVFELDYHTGTAPLTVTARLFTLEWTTWRWLLNGVIHKPDDGWAHTFILPVGRHHISVRGVLRNGEMQEDTGQDVVVSGVVVPPEPVVVPDAYWRMQTFDWFDEGEAAGLMQRKWAGVRVEGTNYDVVMDQCRRRGFRPLWILDRGEHLTCPGNIEVEIGNECNDGCDKWPKLTPQEYADWVLQAWPILRDKGCIVYVGAANNTSVSGLAWTKEVLSKLPLHPQLRVSIHRYPKNPKDQRPDVPQKGHSSIPAEDAAILDCFRGRAFGVSEAGIMDVPYRSWTWDKYFGKLRMRLAVDGHRWQAKRFKKLGSTMYVVYQIHSGGKDLYGQFVDGKWSATSNLPMEAL